MHIFVPILYGVGVAVITFLMRYETNKRLKIDQSSYENEDENHFISQHKCNITQIGFCIILTILSSYIGFIMAMKINSISALIKITICYFATLAAAIIDYKMKIIPNYIPFFLVGSRFLILIYEFIYTQDVIGYLISSIIGCFVSLLFLGIANKVSKGGIGAGDIKLLASIGFMSDIYVVLKSLLLALLCCVVVSIILVALKKRTMKDHLPFGPFIYAGFAGMCLLSV